MAKIGFGMAGDLATQWMLNKPAERTTTKHQFEGPDDMAEKSAVKELSVAITVVAAVIGVLFVGMSALEYMHEKTGIPGDLPIAILAVAGMFAIAISRDRNKKKQDRLNRPAPHPYPGTHTGNNG